MKEYDLKASSCWPHRIPNVQSTALQERLGDCIYNFSKAIPSQRQSVHGSGNIETDLGGKNVLLSKDFYYFGSKAKELPDYLRPICHQTQGHRSNSNAPYFDQFVSWIRSIVPALGQLYGWPDHIVEWSTISAGGGCTQRKVDGETDSGC